MSDGIWNHATAKHPCPICGKPDWCQFGDRAMKCMRVESEKACPSGGWYHFYESARLTRPPIYQARKATGVEIDAESIAHRYASNTRLGRYQELAGTLGVLPEALIALKAGVIDRDTWSFPMRDGNGKVIGIRVRNTVTGQKWAITGSRQGIFVADVPKQPIAFIPEGPTDCAAFLTLGYFPVGRPTDLAGHDYIVEMLSRLGIYRAVIVADNDEMKNLGNKTGRPGILAAEKMKKALRLKSVILYPPSPFKDIREMLKTVGQKVTRAHIESDLRNKIWTK